MLQIVLRYLFRSLFSIGWRVLAFLFVTIIPNCLVFSINPSKKFALVYLASSLVPLLLWCTRCVVTSLRDMKIELFCFSERKRLAKVYEAKEKARHNVSKRTQLRDSVVRSQEPLSLQDAYNKGFQNGFRSGFKYTDKVKNRLKNQEIQKKEIHLCEQVREKMERLCS